MCRLPPPAPQGPNQTRKMLYEISESRGTSLIMLVEGRNKKPAEGNYQQISEDISQKLGVYMRFCLIAAYCNAL